MESVGKEKTGHRDQSITDHSEFQKEESSYLRGSPRGIEWEKNTKNLHMAMVNFQNRDLKKKKKNS